MAPITEIVPDSRYSAYGRNCLIFALLLKTLFFFLNIKKLKTTFSPRYLFSSKYTILCLFSHFEQKSESFYYELRLPMQGDLYLQFKYSMYKVETARYKREWV